MHDARSESPDAPAENRTAPAARTENASREMQDARTPSRSRGESTIAPAPRPQPKSAYELPSRKNTVLRNMLWALALTMAVVVVIAIAFFGVGSDLEREPLENSELDVAASAERAGEVAPFPVAVPRLDEGWDERSARFTDGQSPRWVVQYTSPTGGLVTLTEESEVSASMLSSALPGSAVEEELVLEGAECSLLLGGEQSGEQGSSVLGIACEGEDWGVVVHGGTDRAELEEVASAAIASLG
ncbi:DUF4245 family protein [Brachybacterium sp. AOP43-C2-M15]|uniref:DUF4245 family protein n=1 Tax=Brachybacterium sp. AOP43-C2-M15 TaxID=3457661 RepID=UPI004034456F